MHAAVRDAYPFPPARAEYRPMTGSKADIRDLQSILLSVETDRKLATTSERRLADALRLAITRLEEASESRSSVMWVLAALRQSLRRPTTSGGAWYIVDRDLYTWAVERLDDLVGPIDGVH